MAAQSGENDVAATTEDTAQTAIDLRWQGHKFQAQNICLNNRHEDTIARLQGRGDRETRHALLSLLKESKAMNGALAGHLALMSNANQGLVDILQKSKDGGAALTMRRAAELLVKGLAGAEEEVHALKASIQEAVGQRDQYRAALAKMNSELKAAHAYAQMSKVAGEGAVPSERMVGEREDDAIAQPPVKRKKGGAAVGKGKRSRGVETSNAREELEALTAGYVDATGAVQGTNLTEPTVKEAATATSGQKELGDGHGASASQTTASAAGPKPRGAAARISKPGTAQWGKEKRAPAKIGSNMLRDPGDAIARAWRSAGPDTTKRRRGADRTRSAQEHEVSFEPIKAGESYEQQHSQRSPLSLVGTEDVDVMARGTDQGEGEGVLTKDVRVESSPVSALGAEGLEHSLLTNYGGDDNHVTGGDDVQSVYDSDDAPSMFF